jgi:hypothetical protein
MANKEVWVGIDVSKRRLDVALGVHGELLQVEQPISTASGSAGCSIAR